MVASKCNVYGIKFDHESYFFKSIKMFRLKIIFHDIHECSIIQYSFLSFFFLFKIKWKQKQNSTIYLKKKFENLYPGNDKKKIKKRKTL